MKSASIVWVGGEHNFALTIGNLRALQECCNAGPNEVFERLRNGYWRVDDLFETVRQGLIGGGMKGAAASELVVRMFERHPLREFESIASAILLSALVGVEDDAPGELEGETLPPENGVSPESTATAP